jgi:hypothetical protein
VTLERGDGFGLYVGNHGNLLGSVDFALFYDRRSYQILTLVTGKGE